MEKLTPEQKTAKDKNLRLMTEKKLKYEELARILVNRAMSDGIVLTVDLKPNTPVRTGWFRPIVQARFLRDRNSEYPNTHVVTD